MLQRTLVIVKPDGVYNGWVHPIKKRYEDIGLKVIERHRLRMTLEDAAEFYSEHASERFFAGLILAMSSWPIVSFVVEGEDVIERVRKLNGATDPNKAEPGTIRHDFKSAGGPFNTVHASDSAEAFEREYRLSQKWEVVWTLP